VLVDFGDAQFTELSKKEDVRSYAHMLVTDIWLQTNCVLRLPVEHQTQLKDIIISALSREHDQTNLCEILSVLENIQREYRIEMMREQLSLKLR
jgi:hypothetical protein